MLSKIEWMETSGHKLENASRLCGSISDTIEWLWLLIFVVTLLILPTPAHSLVFPAHWGLGCALCFPSSWGVQEERTARWPRCIAFMKFTTQGLFTPDRAVTHDRWIRWHSLRGEQGSVTIQLCRKAWTPSCHLAEMGTCLPTFCSQQLCLPKRKSHFALSLPASCLPWVLRDLKGFLPLIDRRACKKGTQELEGRVQPWGWSKLWSFDCAAGYQWLLLGVV